MSQHNQSLLEFESPTDSLPDAKESAPTGAESKQPAYTPGDTVPFEEIPNWGTWNAKASSNLGFTVVYPSSGGSNYIEPVDGHLIRRDQVAFLPNQCEVTDRRLESPYPSLTTQRDLPTTYNALEAEADNKSEDSPHSEPFDPLIIRQSILADGYRVIDYEFLEDAYRITQKTGQIDPNKTRITPLNEWGSMVESRETGHTYLLANRTRKLSHPAVRQQSYSPTTRDAGPVSIPDDNPQVAHHTAELHKHIKDVLGIKVTKHCKAESNAHVFRSQSGSRYTIQNQSLKRIANSVSMDNKEKIMGEMKLPLNVGTASVTVSESDHRYRYGDWVHESLKAAKVIRASFRVTGYGASSAYGRNTSRQAEITYYSLRVDEQNDRPDKIRVSEATKQALGKIPYTDISYRDDN